MPQAKTITVYNYGELNEKAKERACNWLLECSYGDEWWDSTYEDATTIGLKLTSFDLDRNRHAEGEFITTAEDCAKAILKEHGEGCETYKTAQSFLDDLKALTHEKSEDEDKVESLGDEFLKGILEDYSILLQKESEYLSSREYLEEVIEANGYQFLENGEIA